MMYNAIISGIRTGVATLAGLLITWLLAKGVNIDPDFATQLSVAVFTAVTVLYNAGVNWAATRWSPYFGYLLGIPKTPTYETTEAK